MSSGIRLGGLTNTLLNYYRSDAYPMNTSGPWAAAIPLSVVFTRIGNQVTIQFLANAGGVSTQATATTASLILFDVPVPPIYRVSQNVYNPIIVRNNSIAEVGRVQLTTTGNLVIARIDGQAFTNTGTCGFVNCSVSYII